MCGLIKWYGGLMGGVWFNRKGGGEWGCDGV
jgi:hypothetical protein